MNMAITDKTIEIILQIHAQESVTLPLPAEYEQWFPNQVLDNGKAAQALYRNNNGLWINLRQRRASSYSERRNTVIKQIHVAFTVKTEPGHR